MYNLEFTSAFEKSYKRLTKQNKDLGIRIRKSLLLLRTNIYHPGLKSHKVTSRRYGKVNSIRVTGDVRILWEFKGSTPIIYVIDIGGHDYVY